MTAHDAVRLVAASMTTVGLVLANLVHPAWLGLSAFVGLNLVQFSVTGFCPALWLLKRAGLKPKPPGAELEAARFTQMVVGWTLFVASGVGYFAPVYGLPAATVIGGLVALSFGQSAITGTCPTLALGRRITRS